MVSNHFYKNPAALEALFINEWPYAAGQQTEEGNAAAEEGEEEHPLTAEEQSQMFNNIQQRIGQKARVVKWVRATLAAAAVLVAATVLIWLQSPGKQAAVQVAAAGSTAPQQSFTVTANTTGKAMAVVLADSSVVTLQPGAAIKYLPFAGQPKRDVYLYGTAFFKVAKNKAKPFTVLAGGTATTALGTMFNVQQQQRRVTVSLYQGKVVVKALAAVKAGAAKQVYLLPGQQVVYDWDEATLNVTAIPNSSNKTAGQPYEANVQAPVKFINDANWYMFNNQGLAKVFEQLEEIYNVKINYNAADFKNVYFIGKLEKADSVETVLNNIALLKKLTIKHTGNTYTITKKTH